MKRFEFFDRYSLIFLLLAIVSFFYLDLSLQAMEERLFANVKNSYIHHIQETTANIDRYLHTKIKKDPYQELKQNAALRSDLEAILSLFINSNNKFIFMLYKDTKGRFRYLLDGSPKERGLFGQKIDVDKKRFNQVYTTKKPLLIPHKHLTQIWLTYVHPLLFEGRVKAVLVIDFSPDLPHQITRIIAPLKTTVKAIIVALTLLLLFILYQFYLLYKAKRASFIDPLTKLYNRTFLREFLKNEDGLEYYILMIDIDHFKKINDNYGHKAGDEILYQVAQTIRSLTRSEDILIRYGGEEFILFIPKTIPKEQVIAIANRIKEHIEKSQFTIDGKSLKVTLSIGINLHSEHYKTVADAIKEADMMLYEAKRTGRNRVVFASKQKRDEGIDIHEVDEALEEGRVLCLYQPIISLRTKEVVKYEALVRLRDEEGNIIPPYLFLEQIAYTSTYLKLTKQVLEIVFATIKEKGVALSINLKFSDILDNKIYSSILEELQSHKEWTRFLTIELLESEGIKQTQIIKERIETIKTFGVSIAIDDFGSGYSNFDIFRVLPIDILKIDGSLIKNITTEKISYTTVKSIQLFAKELGIETVTEFVENEAIVKTIQELGITYAQGYYFSPPKEL